jgi:hypothetical protein
MRELKRRHFGSCRSAARLANALGDSEIEQRAVEEALAALQLLHDEKNWRHSGLRH